ncbi:MAG TPA: hypothetical protein DCQ14_00400, partial [Firmicutes bacterium]|nr:hypothetical protein [Bacillota bacterium]
MTYGNHGKLLRINLQHNSFQVEDISTKVWQEVIGGKGLGTYLLLQEVNPATDPLSAENKLIFVTGPACDTRIPASSRYGVFSKSPLTGIYAESYAGGHVASFMKRTGFDAIILEDKASSPVFLHINQGGATFYEADNIWGMETYDAEDYLREKAGWSRSQALVIGTPMMVSILNEVNSFPSRYWYQGSVEHRDNISAEYMKDNLYVRPRACRGC